MCANVLSNDRISCKLWKPFFENHHRRYLTDFQQKYNYFTYSEYSSLELFFSKASDSVRMLSKDPDKRSGAAELLEEFGQVCSSNKKTLIVELI